MMPVQDAFPPLQTTIAHAESWRIYVKSCQEDLREPSAKDILARAENCVGIGIHLGELLPLAWHAAFHALFRPRLQSWQSGEEFESLRQKLRALFYTVREAMEGALKTGEMLQALTGRQPAGLERLLLALKEARDLEEKVFRDWPSFIAPPPAGDSLPVQESLAEALGISVDEARQKMDVRRQQLNARSE